MAYETRSGRRYYYRKHWTGGTCQSEYIGNGRAAILAAQLDRIKRTEAAIERAVRQKEINLDRQLDAVIANVKQVTHAVLRLTGHYQHKRQWRKMSDKSVIPNSIATTELLKRMQDGTATKAHIEAFKEAVDAVPAVLEVFSLVKRAEGNLIAAYAGKDKALAVATKKKIELMKIEYGYDQANVMERMLIDTVIMSWLRLWSVEIQATMNIVDNLTSTSLEFWSRLISVSQRRHLRAIETLARVRRLAIRTPGIFQVNIARNQVVNN